MTTCPTVQQDREVDKFFLIGDANNTDIFSVYKILTWIACCERGSLLFPVKKASIRSILPRIVTWLTSEEKSVPVWR